MNNQSKETRDLIQFVKDDNEDKIQTLDDNDLLSNVNTKYVLNIIKNIKNSSSYFVQSHIHDHYDHYDEAIYYMMKSNYVSSDNYVEDWINIGCELQDIIYDLTETKLYLEKENLKLKRKLNKLVPIFKRRGNYITHLEAMPGGPAYREAKKRFEAQDYQL